MLDHNLKEYAVSDSMGNSIASSSKVDISLAILTVLASLHDIHGIQLIIGPLLVIINICSTVYQANDNKVCP